MTQSKLKSLNDDWSNYWEGRVAERAGSALVGVEKHPAIKKYWNAQFKNLPKDSSTLDLACGAGTVAKILDESGFTNITGLDISIAAVEIIQKSLPNVRGVVSPADETPFADQEFDVVVSQYGFEYGDFNKVIPEVSRILKPKGKFIALSHITGSAIHTEVTAQFLEMKFIRETLFIDAAKAMFTFAITGKADGSSSDIEQQFRSAQLKLFPVAQNKRGLAEYLYVNTQNMYNNRQNYAYEDVMNWLEGIKNDVDRFIGRMSSMKDAAIDEKKMHKMRALFQSEGIELQEPDVLRDENGDALGYTFIGTRLG